MNPSQPASVQLDPSAVLRAQLVASGGAIDALTKQLAYADQQFAALQKENAELKQKLSGDEPGKN